MITNYLNWRVANEVDAISSFEFPELEIFKELYPHGYHQTDKYGRPIYIERLGQLKLKEVFKHTNEERMIKYFVRSYENLINNIFPACSNAVGRRID